MAPDTTSTTDTERPLMPVVSAESMMSMAALHKLAQEGITLRENIGVGTYSKVLQVYRVVL